MSLRVSDEECAVDARDQRRDARVQRRARGVATDVA